MKSFNSFDKFSNYPKPNLEKLDFSFMIENDIDNTYLSYFILKFTEFIYTKLPLLRQIFIEFIFTHLSFNLNDILLLDRINDKFVYLENPRVITVRYSRYDKDEKNFSNYIDKVVKKPSSTAFYLLLCRHSKTSCLRKLHKYVIQQINKFLSHSMKTVVDNTMYKFYDYVIDKY